MPFKASTAQDNDALPACAHLPPRSGLVQRFLSLVEGLVVLLRLAMAYQTGAGKPSESLNAVMLAT